MAWTAPRTWIVGEVVTAALMNTHVRDNLLAIGQHVRIVKTATETVNSSTTLQDDNELLFTVNSGETWAVEMLLFYSSNATADFKAVIVATATSTGGWGGQGQNTTGSFIGFNNALGAGINFDGLGQAVKLWAGVIVGATGGTIKLQWAQTTSDPVNTQVLIGSSLVAHRVA